MHIYLKNLYVLIDESVIPFVGCLSFRQYSNNKRHRYGVKEFKLCVYDRYTVDFRLYAGKDAIPGLEVSTKSVLEMIHYLNFGGTIYRQLVYKCKIFPNSFRTKNSFSWNIEGQQKGKTLRL